MKRWVVAMGWAVAGCAAGPPVVQTANLTPLNQAAASIGIPSVAYVIAGAGAGQVTVDMPDGEILSGRFTMAQPGGFVTGENSAPGPTGIVSVGGAAFLQSSDDSIWVSASGPKTRFTCDAGFGPGHGEGICKTSTGAAYRLIY